MLKRPIFKVPTATAEAKRHSIVIKVTQKEVAALIGYSHRTLRRRLSEQKRSLKRISLADMLAFIEAERAYWHDSGLYDPPCKAR